VAQAHDVRSYLLAWRAWVACVLLQVYCGLYWLFFLHAGVGILSSAKEAERS